MTSHMIPPFPRYYTASSHEGAVFDSLHNGLTDDYYVLHSFRLNGDNARSIKEVDFVLYNRKKGILCLEIKAGSGISYKDGEWRYSDGTSMSKRRSRFNYYTGKNEDYKVGPYHQAEAAHNAFKDKLTELGLENKCKVVYAVWFCDLSREDFNKITNGQIGELQNIAKITLCKEDKQNPVKVIEHVFDGVSLSGQLNAEDERVLFSRFLIPEFNIVPTTYAEKISIQEASLQMLTREQSRVLDFLEGQRSVVINGTAGTGKTFVAREKAVREAERGKKVLFLCYNRYLCDKLKEDLKGVNNIDVMTLHSLCLHMKVDFGDWENLFLIIDQKKGSLPWEHIVIDEGQDFSAKCKGGFGEEAEILSALEKSLLSDDIEDSSKSFTVFYDRYQLIQGDKNSGAGWKLTLPEYIANADCKLTLYRNCRNSERVARSFMGVMGLKSYLYQCVKPPFDDATHIAFCAKGIAFVEKIKNVFASEKEKYFRDENNKRHNKVVVVSVGQSALKDSTLGKLNQLAFGKDKNGREETGRATIVGTDIPVYTARTYKGLESDAVILIDMSPEVLLNNSSDAAYLFYTAASRAKFSLKIIIDWSVDECKTALGIINPEVTSLKKLGKEIASRFKASYSF